MKIGLSLASALVLLVLFPLSTAAAPQCGQWDQRIGVPGIGGPGNPTVYCSTSHDDGTGDKLYVGGNFQAADGQTVNNLACWDGTAWSPLGGGTNGPVQAMTFFDDGQGAKLYIGGQFTMADGLPANHIARWNGTRWTEVGGGANGTVYALLVGSIGAGGAPLLYVGGGFTTAGTTTSVNNLVTWDGSTWQKLGTGVNGMVRSLGIWDGGGSGAASLYASGTFNAASGTAASKIARWDGASWSALGAGLSNEALAITAFDDGSGEKLYVGGVFNHAGGALIWYIASWDGANWAPVGAQANNAFCALLVHDDGNGPRLYAGGFFTTIGSDVRLRIARWDGSSWEPVGSGIDSSGGPLVFTLCAFQDALGSALLAGGIWHGVDKLPSEHVALWRGESVGVTYCTAKVTSGGCLPAMSASGTPNLGAPSGFTITAGQLRPNSFGLMFFTLSGTTDVPFQDGHLCVKSPFYRLPVKNSGGSGSCSGSLSYSLAEILAHPAGGPLVHAGSRLDVQTWFRDPQSASATGLSDGIDFYVCP